MLLTRPALQLKVRRTHGKETILGPGDVVDGALPSFMHVVTCFESPAGCVSRAGCRWGKPATSRLYVSPPLRHFPSVALVF